MTRWEDALVAFGKGAGFEWETLAQDRGAWDSWEEAFVKQAGGSRAAREREEHGRGAKRRP